jgi:hypothetical protein
MSLAGEERPGEPCRPGEQPGALVRTGPGKAGLEQLERDPEGKVALKLPAGGVENGHVERFRE